MTIRKTLPRLPSVKFKDLIDIEVQAEEYAKWAERKGLTEVHVYGTLNKAEKFIRGTSSLICVRAKGY